MAKKYNSNVALKMLNVFQTYPDRWFTTKELCDLCNSERKSVYLAANILETHGWSVLVEKGIGGSRKGSHNIYKYNGRFGLPEVTE